MFFAIRTMLVPLDRPSYYLSLRLRRDEVGEACGPKVCIDLFGTSDVELAPGSYYLYLLIFIQGASVFDIVKDVDCCNKPVVPSQDKAGRMLGLDRTKLSPILLE